MFKPRRNRKPYSQPEMVASFESYLKVRGVTNEKELWTTLNKDLLKLFQRREVTRLIKSNRVIWCLIKSSIESTKV